MSKAVNTRAPKEVVRPLNTALNTGGDPHDLNPTQSVGKETKDSPRDNVTVNTDAPAPAKAPISNIVGYEGLDPAVVFKALWDHLAHRALTNVLQMPAATAQGLVKSTDIEYKAEVVMAIAQHDPLAMKFTATAYNRFFDASGQTNAAQIVIDGLRTSLEVSKPK